MNTTTKQQNTDSIPPHGSTIVRSPSTDSIYILHPDCTVLPQSKWISCEGKQAEMWRAGYRTEYCNHFLYDCDGFIVGYDTQVFSFDSCENSDHVFDFETKLMTQAHKHGFRIGDFCFTCMTDVREIQLRRFVLNKAILRDFAIESYNFKTVVGFRVTPKILCLTQNIIDYDDDDGSDTIRLVPTLYDDEMYNIDHDIFEEPRVDFNTYYYSVEKSGFLCFPKRVFKKNIIKKDRVSIENIKNLKPEHTWPNYMPSVLGGDSGKDLQLLTRIGKIIKAFRSNDDMKILKPRKNWMWRHLKSSFVRDNIEEAPLVFAQMESAHGTEDERPVSASNVVLGETQVESTAIATKVVPPDYFVLSTSEACKSYTDVTDRFTLFKEFEWNTQFESGRDLAHFRVPYDILKSIGFENSSFNGNVPILVPFRIYRYWRGDIEIKIQVNSNKFQVGQLQCSFYYGDSQSILHRTTVFQCSQLPHVLVNAGASNEATLYIPYKYFTPFLHTKRRKNYVQHLDFGIFRILVNVPLRTSDTGPRSCGVALFVRLINSNFTGMIDGSIVEPQMMKSGPLQSIGRVVDSLIGDLNCDLPPDTSAPRFLVPTASHSWSFGTGNVEPIHSLRLDGNAKASGSGSDTGLSETQISIPCRTFGMLKHITWNAVSLDANKYGYKLWDMDVHPLCDKDRLDTRLSHAEHLTEYTVPPVGVVSSLFQYWRGSLEFRFDIIASQFHTGRLLVAYIPGAHDGTNVTIDQAKNSAHVVFSLQDAQSFSFIVPYIADKPWWYRKYAGPQRRAEFAAPSRIYMFVLNSLIPMESVTKQLTIVPYIRAHIDFEVAIPVQPSLGLTFDTTNTIATGKKLTFVDGYYPAYAGEWRNFGSGKYYILRYGNVTDHVSQARLPKLCLSSTEYVYWRLDEESIPNWNMRITGGDKPVDSPIKFVTTYKDGTYTYMVPFPSTEEIKAASFAETYFKDRRIDRAITYAIPYVADGKASPNGKRIYFVPVVKDTRSKRSTDLISDDDLVDYVVPQMMGEQTFSANILQPTSSLSSTGSGMRTFSERFDDLKDLSRRYQLYWEGSISYDLSRFRDRSFALFQFPAIPSGLRLDVSEPSKIWNYLREGTIPIISSGYRYFRGDIKFRIVFPNDFNYNVWIQHHPDKPLDYDPTIVLENALYKADGFRNHGYAFYIQSTRVNNIVEFSVPFYQPGVYGILNRIPNPNLGLNSSDYASLGDIIVGVSNIGERDVRGTLNCTIYYAMGDSMKFEVFTGFPNMVFCDDVFECVEPQMMEAITGGIVSNLASNVTQSLLSNPLNKAKIYVRDSIVEGVTQSIKPKADEICQEIRKTKQFMNDSVNEIKIDVHDWVKQSGMTMAVTELMHVLTNPTPMTVAISVSGIICLMLQGAANVAMSLSSQLIQVLTKLFESAVEVFSFGPHNPSSGPDAADFQASFSKNTGESLDKHLKALSSVIFVAIVNMFGATLVGPKYIPDLIKGVSSEVTLVNNIMTFLNNCGDMILYYIKYCLTRTNVSAQDMEMLEREFPEIEEWLTEVNYLLDPRVKSNISHNPNNVNRVFDACVYGSLILSANLHVSVPGGKIINDCYKDICRVRDDIVDMGNHPDVRFKCFPIWLFGPPGVGKSFITDSICKTLLQRINYRTKETMIYWLTCNTKYWNGVKNPPVIARDDAYNLDGLALDEELANHFMIDSNCILNPNMAAVDEKNKRLNPLIYFMNSNFAFPHIPTAKCPEAVYRRRKALIEVDWTDEIKQQYPHLTDSDEISDRDLLATFEHLKFRFAHNVKDVNTTYTDWMSYDMMMSKLCESFHSFYKRERENFVQRVKTAYALDVEYIPPTSYKDYEQTIPVLSKITPLREKFNRMKEAAERRIMLNGSDAPPEILPIIQDYLSKIGNYISGFVFSQGPNSTTDFVITEEDWRGVMLFGEGHHRAQQIIEKFAFGSGLPEYILDRVFENFDIKDIKYSDLAQVFISRAPLSVNETYCTNSPDYYAPLSGYRKYLRDILPYVRLTEFKTRQKVLPLSEGDDCLRIYLERLLIAENIRSNEKYHKAIVDWLSDPNGYFNQFVSIVQDVMVGNPGALHAVNKHLSLFKTNAEFVETYLCVDMVLYQVAALALKYPRCHDFHCPLSEFFYEQIGNIDKVSYCASRNCFIARGCFKMSYTCSFKCECEDCLFKNPIFLVMMDQVWEQYHCDGDRPNFITGNGYRETWTSWVALTKSHLKCWWYHYLEPSLTSCLKFWIEWWPSISMWMGFAGLAMGAVKACKWIGNKFSSCKDDESFENINYFRFDAPKHPKPQKHKINAKVFEKPEITSKENCGNLEKAMVLKRKIEDNTIILHCNFQRDTQPLGARTVLNARCLALKNRTVLILRHYYEEFAEHANNADAKFRVYYNRQGSEGAFDMTYEDLFGNITPCYVGQHGKYEYPSNYALLELPKFVHQFKDITGWIATRDMHENAMARTGHLYVIDGESTFNIPITVKRGVVVKGEDGITEIPMDTTYRYPRQAKGLCGAILVAPNMNNGNGGIIGVHVAGSPSLGGVAEPIYREMLSAYFQLDDTIADKYDYYEPDLQDIGIIQVDGKDHPLKFKDRKVAGNVAFLGKVLPDYVHHESGRTRIVPSILHDKVYKHTTEPNPLRPNDPRQPPGSHPLRDGCSKHGASTVEAFPTKDLDIVQEDVFELMKAQMLPLRQSLKPLTMQEAICGNRNFPYFDAMKFNTSEGFPLVFHRPKSAHNKKWLFDLEEKEDGYELNGINDRLQLIMDARDELFKRGIAPFTVYIDFLKDYRLPIEKCRIRGKTRIVSIAPVQTCIDFRVHCMDYTAAYKASRIKMEHGIGINPDSMEWTDLVNYLHEVGPNIVCGDYSNYGPNLASSVVYRANQNMINWYKFHGASDNHMKRISWIMDNEIMNPVHLCEDVVYKVVNGIASGSPITAEHNSEPNKMYIRLMWLSIMRENRPEYANMSSFRKFCRVVVYGDDIILSVADEVLELFNLATISKEFAKFGITFTGITKDDNIIPYTSIFEAQFLKRGFALHPKRPGVWLAPVDEKSIKECINWSHICDDEIEATLEVCRASMDLAYSHGPVFYNDHRDKIQKALSELNIGFECVSWRERDQEIFGDISLMDPKDIDMSALKTIVPWFMEQFAGVPRSSPGKN